MSSSNTRRRTTTEKLAQRKRATIACQFCRLRKTKCDGIRPVCSFCQYHDAQCVWGPTAEDDGVTPTEKEILRRLDELKDLLADSKAASPAAQSSGSASRPVEERLVSPITATSNQSHAAPSSSMASPFSSTRCESILAWPVFRNIIGPEDLAVESFVLELDIEPHEQQKSSHRLPKNINTSLGIQEDQFVPLCRKFLVHVHARNPILQGTELIRYAKRATEHGIGWESSSCLVVSQRLTPFVLS